MATITVNLNFTNLSIGDLKDKVVQMGLVPDTRLGHEGEFVQGIISNPTDVLNKFADILTGANAGAHILSTYDLTISQLRTTIVPNGTGSVQIVAKNKQPYVYINSSDQ